MYMPATIQIMYVYIKSYIATPTVLDTTYAMLVNNYVPKLTSCKRNKNNNDVKVKINLFCFRDVQCNITITF